MALLFTGDLHLGHNNVLPSRPQFQNIDEHDNYLLEKWNRKVNDSDEVYILGDLCFRSSHNIEYYLQQMKGKKHLIIGNHDSGWMKKSTNLDKLFCSINSLTQIKFEHRKITLCHFPMLEWSGSRYIHNESSFLIHGHIHGMQSGVIFDFIKQNLPHALNACVDVNNFEPVTFDELRENNKSWYNR